jgi:3-hydroxymyristoyl/3-hydroxydecanoyl-(acyl carrier protein) dehydratase
MADPHAHKIQVVLSMKSFTQEQLAALRLPSADVLELSADRAVLEFPIRADNVFFQGHYANHPILPGIAQIDWVILCARWLFSIEADFHALSRIKFYQGITPGCQLTLTLEYRAAQMQLDYRIHSVVGEHASGQVRFRQRTSA